MWRFRLGHPVTSAVTATIEASAAQVTEAGLTIDLDEWGGCKSAKWTGLTGGQQDRARVWIDVADGAAPGGWRCVFSGAMVRRPAKASGEREAVGDRYLRLKEIPVEVPYSGGSTASSPGVDVGAAIRAIGETVRAFLPHLVVSAVPDAGVQGRRQHNGESAAAAFEGLISLKAEWGWTVRPDDSLYIGPLPAEVETVNAALPGVRLELRDVVSEGLRNAVRWVYRLADGRQVVHESQHPSVGTVGRSALSRYIDRRNAPAVTGALPATYYQNNGGAEFSFTYEDLSNHGLNDAYWPVNGYTRLVADAAAAWVELDLRPGADATVTMSGSLNYTEAVPAGGRRVLTLPAVQAGDEVRVTRLSGTSGPEIALYEFTPVGLRGSVLDTAAENLYRIPADHAGTASVPGIRPPVGSVLVQRPGLPDLSERVVGTRYLVRRPLRTEYLIGEPDDPADNLSLKALIERRDEQAVDQAVNTGGTP